MRSVMCASCGLVGWADAGNCKRCGQSFSVNQQPPRVSTQRDYNNGHDYNYAPPPDNFGAPPEKRKGYAVASLIIGIVGFFSFGILLIGTIVGTSLGIVALSKGSKQPNVYGGKGLAVAGIVVNIAALFMIVPLIIIAAIAIPNLLAASRAANEASAISNLRLVYNAESTYAATVGNGSYGSIPQLVRAGLMDGRLLSGTKNGYVFTVTASGNDFEVRATPLTDLQGHRSFYVSSGDGGEIHFGLNGLPAAASDPTLDTLYGPQYNQPATSARSLSAHAARCGTGVLRPRRPTYTKAARVEASSPRHARPKFKPASSLRRARRAGERAFARGLGALARGALDRRDVEGTEVFIHGDAGGEHNDPEHRAARRV
jgi:type II secretory pathway pseudopilin PulG